MNILSITDIDTENNTIVFNDNQPEDVRKFRAYIHLADFPNQTTDSIKTILNNYMKPQTCGAEIFLENTRLDFINGIVLCYIVSMTVYDGDYVGKDTIAVDFKTVDCSYFPKNFKI